MGRPARGQTVLEFLMTYGWAIMVIVIILAVLFYMGVLNPKGAVANTCVFPPGYACYSSKLANGSGALALDLGQATGKSIQVTMLSCSRNESAPLQPLPNSVTIPSGEHRWIAGDGSGNPSNCTDEAGGVPSPSSAGERYKGRLCIGYIEPATGTSRTVCGDISARFEPGGVVTGEDCAPNCALGSGCASDPQCAQGYCLSGACSDPTGWIFGTVTNNTGSALSGANVTAGSGATSASNTTNSSGQYIIYVPRGSYNVTASKSGYVNRSSAGSVTPQNGTSVSLTLYPSPACALGGAVSVCPCTLNVPGIYTLASNLTSSSTCITISSSGGVTLDCAGNLITGTKAASTYGVYLNQSNSVSVKNCVINNFTNGIYAYFADGNSITGNTAYNNSVGIKIEDSDRNSVTGNNMSLNTQMGAYLVYSSVNNNIAGNIANSNTQYGIVAYAHRNVISGNTANSNQVNGIYLSGTTNSNITDNTAYYNWFGGIRLDSSSSNNITNNRASNNTYASSASGIFLYQSSNNNITGNTAAYNTDTGIYLDSSSNCRITNNIVPNNLVGIGVAYTNSNNTITGNTANSNRNRGIAVSTTSSAISNNVANLNKFYGIILSAATNNTVSGNNANSNNDTGIYLSGSSNNSITGNTASSNLKQGISLVTSSNYNNVTDNNFDSNLGDYGGVNLFGSSNNTFRRDTANSNVQYGFFIWESSANNTISDSNATGNNFGIWFQYAANNTITNSTFSYNRMGVFIAYSSSSANNLTGNTVNYNNQTGVTFYGSVNTFAADNTVCYNNVTGGGYKDINCSSGATFVAGSSGNAYSTTAGACGANLTDSSCP